MLARKSRGFVHQEDSCGIRWKSIFVGGEEYVPESLQQEETIEETSEDEATRAEFVLERYLEEFVVTNFESIFKRDGLELYETDDRPAHQYLTDVGRIDILGWKPSTNSFVVIELKKGRESDQVIGQVLRYMQWVKDNLCNKAQKVEGLIICRERDEKLDYSLRMIADKGVSARLYEISFDLRPWETKK
jgi:restriction system protein